MGEELIMKSKKMKSFRATEGDIQSSIIKYLSTVRDIYFWRQNSMGVPLPKGGFRKAPTSGVSDIVLLYKGLAYFLEIKRDEHSEIRDSQIEFKKNVEMAGAKYYIVWSVDMVAKIIDEIKNPTV